MCFFLPLTRDGKGKCVGTELLLCPQKIYTLLRTDKDVCPYKIRLYFRLELVIVPYKFGGVNENTELHNSAKSTLKPCRVGPLYPTACNLPQQSLPQSHCVRQLPRQREHLKVVAPSLFILHLKGLPSVRVKYNSFCGQNGSSVPTRVRPYIF